jgi:hypothetical protein
MYAGAYNGDPKLRLRDIGEARIVLSAPGEGRDDTGQSGRHGTRVDRRALSRVTCRLYEEISEFDKAVDPFFKTSNDIGAKDLRLSICRRLPT